MKLFLTGLLLIALNGWLFAQENSKRIVDSTPGNGYYQEEGPSVTEPSGEAPFKADYKLLAELGYGAFGSENFSGMLIAEIINGFQLSPHFYVGVGTGVRVVMTESGFWDGTFAFPTIPLYADLRFFLSPGNVSPYIAVDAGYTWDVSYGVIGLGFMITPMAGLSFGRHNRFPVHVGVGYDSQMMKDYFDDDDKSRSDKVIGTFVFTAGITF